jgi:hypothetical protein
MKRYMIFGIIGPFIGGLILLLVTTFQSGYFHETNLAEFSKLFVVFIRTLQYSYLFGVVPSLMIGAIDDILYHVKRIGPVLRMLIVAVIAFAATTLLYGSRGPDSGILQVFLYGLVGFVPGTLSSWLSHRYADEQKTVRA